MEGEFKKILAKYGLEFFNKYYGIYRGLVVDNQDPEFLGRLIVRVPQIHKNNVPTTWAFSKGMFTGKDQGFYALPGVGDWVWTQFEGGNPSHPVWEYGHWAMGETPAAVKTVQDRAKIYVFQTADRSRLEFNNEQKYIRLFRSDGQVIEVNDDVISLGSMTKSEYHAVLGERAEDVLESLRTHIDTLQAELSKYANTQISAATSVGILAPLLPGYIPLLAAMKVLAVLVEELKSLIPEILSRKVTLDK